MTIYPGEEAEIDLLNHLIIEFNLQQIPFPENPPWKTLSYVFKEKNKLLGGIYGYLIRGFFQEGTKFPITLI